MRRRWRLPFVRRSVAQVGHSQPETKPAIELPQVELVQASSIMRRGSDVSEASRSTRRYEEMEEISALVDEE